MIVSAEGMHPVALTDWAGRGDGIEASPGERSRLSHQIARMEARGTVRREACPDDARGFDVLLTDTGLAAIRAAAPGHLSVLRHCFADVLTPEQLDTLGDIAEAITPSRDRTWRGRRRGVGSPGSMSGRARAARGTTIAAGNSLVAVTTEIRGACRRHAGWRRPAYRKPLIGC